MQHKIHKQLRTSGYFLFFFVVLVQQGVACRYNIRETGFVYLAQKTYQLKIYFNQATPEKDLVSIRTLAADHFSESNIEVAFIDVTHIDDTAALPKLTSGAELPVAVLHSPDGQTIELPLSGNTTEFVESTKQVFRSVIASSTRDTIRRLCIENYAVILMFEGSDRKTNQQARAEAEAAIAHVKSKMNLLPKKINTPPVLYTIKSGDKDTILPWSMGLAQSNFASPQLAIVYGRARWIGPILHDQMITKRNLSELLMIVGADCECGIDREWMRGTMIPMAWDQQAQIETAANLEFDPENPLIKKEVRQIMRMGEFLNPNPRFDTVTSIPIVEDTNPLLQPEPRKAEKSSSISMISIIAGITLGILLIGLVILRSRNGSQ